MELEAGRQDRAWTGYARPSQEVWSGGPTRKQHVSGPMEAEEA